MSLRRWYQCVMFLPLLIPSLFWLAGYIAFMLTPAEMVWIDGVPQEMRGDALMELQFPDTPMGNVERVITHGFHAYPLMVQLWVGMPFQVALLPYLLFLCVALLWMRKQQAERIHRKSWLMPLVFLPIALVVMFLQGSSLTGISWNGAVSGLRAVWSAGVLILFYGYVFVIAAHVMTWFVKKKGWVLQ